MRFLRIWNGKEPPTEHKGVHARREAEIALERAKAQRPEVEEAHHSMLSLGNENHFADRVARLIRGGS